MGVKVVAIHSAQKNMIRIEGTGGRNRVMSTYLIHHSVDPVRKLPKICVLVLDSWRWGFQNLKQKEVMD
jgi:hypothetical protein